MIFLMVERIVIIFLLCIFYISGCSSNGSVHIKLTHGTHLEDTVAGSFLKDLHINALMDEVELI